MITKKLSTPSIIGFSLTLLMLVQFLVQPLIPILTKSEQGLSPYYAYVLVIISYSVITAIILLEIKNLEDFHIDNISLWLFTLSCFVRSHLGINSEALYLLPIVLLGLGILFQVIRNHADIPKIRKETILGGMTLACGVLIVVTIAELFQASNWLSPIYSTNIIGVSILRQLIFQLSFVVLIEEFAFRSFLAGYLLKIGLDEKKAFAIQAFFFWLIHYMRSGNLITFYISIPLLAWSTSFAVKRYKQLTASILIHIITNVFVGVLINVYF